MLEFIGNHFLTLSFEGAFEGRYNTGLIHTFYSTNTIYVLAFSYIFFREAVVKSQLLGVFLLIFSVIFVSVFRPEFFSGYNNFI